MMILVDGHPQDEIPGDDRGLQYGDGVFETLAVTDGQALCIDAHLERLAKGCQSLGFNPPDANLLRTEIANVCEGVSRAVVKVIATRGSGGRGYTPESGACARRMVGLWPWPDGIYSAATDGIRIGLCDTSLACNPLLAGMKHLNRLEQVLASAELESKGIDEGLMCDSAGALISGVRSNVFLVRHGQLLTPDLSQCGVAGILRDEIIKASTTIGHSARIEKLLPTDLETADEIFVCNSVIGIWPVVAMNDKTYTIGPVTRELQRVLTEQHVMTAQSDV